MLNKTQSYQSQHCILIIWQPVFYGGPKVSRQFQFVPSNFNLLTAISILLTTISICSRQFQLTAISICSLQFQLTHDNFNLFTAISICSQQFQLTHGNFNLLTAFFTSPTICLSVSCGGRQWPPKVKTQNQESRFKVDLQSEKLQSKMKSRFTKTNASRHWVENRRVYWSHKIISFIKHSSGGLLYLLHSISKWCNPSQ